MEQEERDGCEARPDGAALPVLDDGESWLVDWDSGRSCKGRYNRTLLQSAIPA